MVSKKYKKEGAITNLHVARFRDRLEPSGQCNDDHTRRLLASFRALLRLAGAAVKHPGLVKEHAIDSIGKYLDPVNDERARLMLMDSGAELPDVTLKKKTFQILSVKRSESLDDRQRLLCVPIRGTADVARRLDRDEDALSELTIKLANGATLTLRQHRDPMRMVLTVTSVTSERKTLEGALKPDHAKVLFSCFHGAGQGLLGVVPEEPIVARKIALKQGRGFHELPTWMTEHLATIAQDIFRVHVLLSGAEQFVSRMIFAEKASVFTFEPTADDPRILIKLVLHPASGGCLCHLHRRESTSQFKQLEFRIKICDQKLHRTSNGCMACPRHSSPDDDKEPSQAVNVNPSHCCERLSFELWCCHDRTNDPRAGLSISLAVPEVWMQALLRELASACCALTRAEDAAVLDLKATVDGVMEYMERERVARRHTEATLNRSDQTAVWLFRNDQSVGINKAGKLTGKRVGKEYQKIVTSHGHLFKKLKV